MKTIELVGHIDAQHRLVAEAPPEVRPGPVKVTITFPTGTDPDSTQWAAGIAREWAEDLGDSRQDIYSIEDGEPEE
jgi:hypothetical protein